MEYHRRLAEDEALAKEELKKKLRLVTPPPIYTDWDPEKEYTALPTDLKKAFAALVAAMEHGGGAAHTPPGITLLGKPGVGKTKAAYTLAHHLLTKVWYEKGLFRPQFEPLILEHVEWVQSVRRLDKYGESAETRALVREEVTNAIRFPGVLFLDDIGVASMPDFISESFYVLVDQRLKNWRPTVFISNANTDDIARNIDPRISHRLLRWTKVITYKN